MLEIIVENIPKGIEGKNFYYQFKVKSSNEKLKWEITGGILPKGLVLETESGVVKGICQEPCRRSLQVIAQNTVTQEMDSAIFLFFVSGAQKLQIVATSLPNAIRGQLYSCQLRASGGYEPYIWSTDDLPDNLVLKTDIITGIPLIGGGMVPINITLRDSKGNTQEKQLMLTIEKTVKFTVKKEL